MKPVKHWLEELDDCIDRGAVIEAIQADAHHAALTEAVELCKTCELDVFDEHDQLWNGGVESCVGKIKDALRDKEAP